MNKDIKPKLIGGIGKRNFGKQYRQGNRIYDSEEIAMCLNASPVGNAGGYSYLYKINDEGDNKIMREFKNNLIKYQYNIEEIKLFDSFAGIGALHQSLKELGVPVKVIGLSEVDIDAIISYAAIHIDNFNNLKFNYPSEGEMKKWLMDKNIGWDFIKQKSSIPRLKKDKLLKVYKASVLLNNLGDISIINYEEIPDFDLFNFSFCCQDLSNAGKQKGLVNEDGTPTRSGLAKYGIELIKVKKPKFIMIENVKALIQKKFINDFYDIINEMKSYGYNCYYPIKKDKKGNEQPCCLNAKDFGIPQNRERIFVICIRKDIDDFDFKFPKGFDIRIRLKNILEETVDKKYYLSEKAIKDIQNSSFVQKIGQVQNDDICSTTLSKDCKDPKYIKEPKIFDDRDKGFGSKILDICPTQRVERNGLKVLETIKLGCTTPSGKSQCNTFYSVDGVSPTLCAGTHGYATGNIAEPFIVASRVRNPENPGDRTTDMPTEQRIEPNTKDLCNTLTSVQKDNYVCIPQATKKGYIECEVPGVADLSYPNSKTRRGRVQENGAVCPTITAESNGLCSIEPKERFFKQALETLENNPCEYGDTVDAFNERVNKSGYCPTLTTRPEDFKTAILPVTNDYRIRKLTPKECWRLMGFRDKCFDKAKECGLSDSALYKQAGNSIVVNCLYYIFKNLFIKYQK